MCSILNPNNIAIRQNEQPTQQLLHEDVFRMQCICPGLIKLVANFEGAELFINKSIILQDSAPFSRTVKTNFVFTNSHIEYVIFICHSLSDSKK